jgi:hypothetical protein
MPKDSSSGWAKTDKRTFFKVISPINGMIYSRTRWMDYNIQVLRHFLILQFIYNSYSPKEEASICPIKQHLRLLTGYLKEIPVLAGRCSGIYSKALQTPITKPGR